MNNKKSIFQRAADIFSKGKEFIYPAIGHGISKLIEYGEEKQLPMYLLEKDINKIYGYMSQDLANRNKKNLSYPYLGLTPPVIRSSPNAGFGIGDRGPNDLSPYNIGDRQEELENMEKIIRNPIPKSYKALAKMKPKRTRKIAIKRTRKPIKRTRKPIARKPVKRTRKIIKRISPPKIYKRKPKNVIIEGSQQEINTKLKPGRYRINI